MSASPSPSYSLTEIAQRFKLTLRGDSQLVIHGVGTLALASPHQLSFLANSHYRNQLQSTRAGAVVLREADASLCPVSAIIADNPYVAYAKIAALFDTSKALVPGIHPSAVISPTAVIDANASVGAHCFIDEGSVIESGCMIGAGCVVGPHCVIGANSRLVARVTLVARVKLGQRVIVHPGAVIGADGFGLAYDTDHWLKVPQLGGVRIGDDCEIGANTTIDRGALGDTILEDDVRLDNLIQIAHNVHIGAHTAIAGCTGIAGSTKIGRGCLIGGAVGITGHISVADNVTITGLSMVAHSITQAGTYSSGIPCQPSPQWRRNVAHLRKLDQITRRLQTLERNQEHE